MIKAISKYYQGSDNSFQGRDKFLLLQKIYKKSNTSKHSTQPHLSDRQIRNPFLPQHSTYS